MRKKDQPKLEHRRTAMELSTTTEQDLRDFRRKLRIAKQLSNKRSKIGPYTVIKPYKGHCLMLTPNGFRESFVYADLAKFVR